jgi:GSH-dependent disulfide-bond oxidoreductase
MLDLYFSPTPNGLKVRLFLEETGLPYRLVPVRLSSGEQFAPAFLAISPNNKIPAIVDHAPRDGGAPLPVFESGAIAPEPVPHAIERYTREVSRLYGVLERRLEGREYLAGDAYSIADVACYPWIVPHVAHGQELARFPQLRRWFERIHQRAATRRVYEGVEDVYATKPDLSAEARKALFQQGAAATAR